MGLRTARYFAVLSLVVGVSTAGSLGTAAADVGTKTWTGAGSDNKWSNPQNWQGGVAPAANDRLVFPPGAAQLSSVDDNDLGFTEFVLTGSGYNLSSPPQVSLTNTTLTVASTSSGNTVSIPFRGTQISVTAGASTPQPQLTLAPPSTSNGGSNRFTGSGDVVINGPINDNGTLVQAGTGTIRILSDGSNSQGVLEVDSGQLVVNGNNQEGVNGYGGVLAGTGHIGRLGTGANVTGPAASLLAPGDPGDGPGSMTIDGLLTDAGLVLETQLDGSQPGAGYDQVNVIGATKLNGAFLDVVPGFQPTIGEQFTIINNDGTDAVQGTFDGLPQGAAFAAGGTFFRVNYQGGDGNDVVLTAINPPPPSVLTAPGSGGGPNVRSFGGRSLSFFAPGGGSGGAYVTAGDLDGDGIDEIVVGTGAGVPSQVYIYGADGSLRGNFAPYGAFTGGVSVAIGDVNGDGTPEIITGPGPGGAPTVSVFNQVGGRSANFFAYDTRFLGGVNVATGDLNGDGVDEIIVGAGSGGGPHVRAFNGDGTPQGVGFFAYDPRFAGGVSVATGDLNGDGVSEVITGAGAGGGPHVRTFAGNGTPLGGGFFAYSDGFFGGVTVGSFPDFGRGHDDLVTGVGPGGGPNVKGFLPDGTPVFSIFAYDAGFTGGVRVAGALLNAPQ